MMVPAVESPSHFAIFTFFRRRKDHYNVDSVKEQVYGAGNYVAEQFPVQVNIRPNIPTINIYKYNQRVVL